MSTNTPQSCKRQKKMRLSYFSERFQLRYGVWLATIGLFCFSLMGFLAYLQLYRETQSSTQPEAVKELLLRLLNPSTLFFRYEVMVPVGILTIFLFSIGIVGTHRIAGPLYAIKRHINRVRLGQHTGPLELRKGDELQDVAFVLNRMILHWEKREKKYADLRDHVKELLHAQDVEAALAKLRETELTGKIELATLQEKAETKTKKAA